jgi:aryl-alcohol dehydrogenase-like predicted oxidoreductase
VNAAVSRICLGTAQLGTPYGIAARSGRPSESEIEKIVTLAVESGIRWFDTAQSYGDSERHLGRLFESLHLGEEVRVSTKLDPDLDPTRADDLCRALEGSLERLRRPSVDALLLHRSAFLEAWDAGLGKQVERWLIGGEIHALGVSVYTPEEVALSRRFPLVTVYHCPLNGLDRRFADVSLFPAASMLFLRSVFLQGLLLLSPEEADRRLPGSAKPVARVHRFCRGARIDPVVFLLGVALAADPHALLVLAVDSVEQLRDNLIHIEQATSPEVARAVDEWSRTDLSFAAPIIDPSAWKVRT